MAYINFKEEKFVAKKQLNSRISNNEKLISKIKSHKKTFTNQCNYEFSFKIIQDKILNNSKTLKETDFKIISNQNILCAHFINCKFYNIRFLNCSFIGCIFENCHFDGGGVLFENCIFIKVESDKKPNLNVKDNLSCTFNNCTMYVKFLNCDISFMILNNCYIKDTSFELTDMTSTIIFKSTLNKINISDCDLSGIKIFDTYLNNLEFNDKLKSKLDEKSFIDKIKLKEKSKSEYEGLYMIYQTIADKFEQNNLKNNFGEYYYLCRCMQRKTLSFFPKLISTFEFLTHGYGERIFAPLISSLIFIFIFALIYLFLGYEINGTIIKYSILNLFPLNITSFLKDFNLALTLSVGIFVGTGEDIATPLSTSYFITNIEMILGVIMIGIGIGTLTRKLIR